ncbi:DUF421 domain-containing protein [Anaerobacillus isosaccharinicus]|uniref:DUF421 domain-containing protein n=1 Tax=Anaerobacillus isosaccharinicus TaxID=1532552 RepID=A0A1S2KTW9_9BACI|nr:DUF421 domain-containing protein [Anaerobacillus isosaccharinicus]MBA5588024.1 DUF421 domain-containing protein [Anaerobacillus isosaccharinicus]QOY33833.1 DUF421 domain-containing protein [Anaerobacillus isosaccharinicus]
MDLDFIWQSIVLVFSGFLLLRISGRKSIAQMTIPTTVVMISIGAIIVHPIIEDSTTRTILTIAMFIAILIFVEFLQVHFNGLEKIFSGKAKVVIENGELNLTNIKSMRLTIDKIETQLRQNGISNISDVKNATIEANGQLGYELKPDARPLTVGEFKKLLGGMVQIQNQSPDVDGNLFYEVINKKHKTPHKEELK